MPLPKPESGYVWLHVPLRDAVEVTVVGDVHAWWSHWTGTPGGRQSQAVRCLAEETGACAWCEASTPRRIRYVWPVLLAGELRLVEVGRVQYSSLAMIYEAGGWIGRRLVLVREWPARNARIQVRSVGREEISSEMHHDVRPYVESLGLGQLALFRVPAQPPPTKAARSGSLPPQRREP